MNTDSVDRIYLLYWLRQAWTNSTDPNQKTQNAACPSYALFASRPPISKNIKSKTRVVLVQIQSTLVISNSKGLSKILRDIRTSTYQNCRIEKKKSKKNRTTTFNKYICNWTLEVRYIENIVENGENCSFLSSNFSSFPLYFLPVVRFSCLGRDQIFTSR